MRHSFYKALGFNPKDRKVLQKFSKDVGISLKKLDYFERNGVLPSGDELRSILEYSKLDKDALMLQMGIFNHHLKNLIAENFKEVLKLKKNEGSEYVKNKLTPVFFSELGKLYQGDCLDILKSTEDNKFDLIFADPPFNLKKYYLSNISDDLDVESYINWTEDWLEECIRTLKDGGSFFLWNLPKWNTHFAAFLNKRLTFRNWIATDMKFSLPISGRLYPSHYSLLYYVKGEFPKAFHPDRLPMEICPKCYTDLKDYGGYKDKMNPLGVNISDVWNDIPPVRHKKYKKREEANELSIKLLDRIIEMASNEGDLVFDPFGGSGTTYIVSEIKKRKWIGVELGPVDGIIDRFNAISDEKEYLCKFRKNYNKLFSDKSKANRMQLKLWTDDTFRSERLSNDSKTILTEN